MTFKSLISEDNENVSMGRVAFWLLFITCVIFWSIKDINSFPPTLYNAFIGTIIYNFGKKGIDSFNEFIKIKTA